MMTLSTVLIQCLVDFLSLGDIVRLHTAICDRETMTSEMRHVLMARFGMTRVPSHIGTVSSLVSSIMLASRSRCCECGVTCRRQSLVCYDCAAAEQSYRSMVSRKDLRTTSDGWRVKERRLLRVLATVKIVARTSNGEFLYWRREAVHALSRMS